MKHFAKFVILVFALAVVGCKVNFNFTGGAADTSLETLSVEIFINEAEIIVPYLAQEVTDQLQDRFLSQSKLSLTSGAADVRLSGSINRYSVLPTAIQGDDRAAQNRLTISIRVNFENNVDPNESWEQNFSGYIDFDADEDFSSEEERLIDEVLEQITQDVFSKSIGKW